MSRRLASALALPIGPAAVCAATVVIPLVYAPPFESPFLEPKLALLLLVGALGWGAWLTAAAAGLPRPRWTRSMTLALGAFVAANLGTAAVAWLRRAPGAPYAVPELARLAATIGIACAAAQAVADPRWRSRLVDGIHVAAGVVSVLGLLQHLHLLPFAIPTISVPGSTLGNRNMAGERVALSIPFGLAALIGHAMPRPRWGTVALLVLELIYLAVTRARGAWIGGAAGVAVFFALARPALPSRARPVLLLVAAAVIAAALLPGRWTPRDSLDKKRYEAGTRVVAEALDPTSPVMRTRFALWRRTLALYAEHPITGIGPGNFGVLFPKVAEPGAAADGVLSPTQVPRRPHDEVLERLAETGPLGLGGWLAIYVVGLSAGLRAARRKRSQDAGDGDGTDRPADLPIGAAAAGALAACFGCGLTAFPQAMPCTALLFGVSVGVLGTRPPSARTDDDERRARPGYAVAAAVGLSLVLLTAAASMGVRATIASYWAGHAERAQRTPFDASAADRQAAAAAALPLLARAEAAGASTARFSLALRTAQVALRAGHPAESAAAAARARAVEPYSPHAWATGAAAALALGDAAEAERQARRALALFADYPLAQTTLAAAKATEGGAGTASNP